uniref:Uncharacterized protein n=1 Tax=Mycolicibacterium neoaurum VKM Ac-1815D TaxID=700508 RepID=V5XIK7_MYCNE
MPMTTHTYGLVTDGLVTDGLIAGGSITDPRTGQTR